MILWNRRRAPLLPRFAVALCQRRQEGQMGRLGVCQPTRSLCAKKNIRVSTWLVGDPLIGRTLCSNALISYFPQPYLGLMNNRKHKGSLVGLPEICNQSSTHQTIRTTAYANTTPLSNGVRPNDKRFRSSPFACMHSEGGRDKSHEA